VIEQQIENEVLHGGLGTDWRQTVASPLAQIQPLVLLEQVLLFLVVVGEQLLVDALLGEDLLLEEAQLVAILVHLSLAHAPHAHTRPVEIQTLKVDLGVLSLLEVFRGVDEGGRGRHRIGSFRAASERVRSRFRCDHRCDYFIARQGREERRVGDGTAARQVVQ
jgi:hypothetical protein